MHPEAAASSGHLPLSSPYVAAAVCLAAAYVLLTISPGRRRGILGVITFDGTHRVTRMACCLLVAAAGAGAAVLVNNHLHHARIVALVAGQDVLTVRQALLWQFAGLALAGATGLYILASLLALARRPRTVPRGRPRGRRDDDYSSNVRYVPVPAGGRGRRQR